jgi:hypothetical protein
MSEDDMESAFWRFDAMRKGLHPFEDREDCTDRDNFKAAVRFHSQPVAHIQAAALRAFATKVRDEALPGETWAQSLALEADRIERSTQL